MRIKIGEINESIMSVDNYVFADKTVNNGGERLSVRLTNNDIDIVDLSNRLRDDFKGEIMLIEDDGKESLFKGFDLQGVRKSYDVTTQMVSVDFFKKNIE